MNSPEIMEKIKSRDGLAASIALNAAAPEQSPDALIDELYLAALSRLPRDDERLIMREAFGAGTDRRQAAEDVLWALLNSKEFLYNH
jgi:hypothetical protein